VNVVVNNISTTQAAAPIVKSGYVPPPKPVDAAWNGLGESSYEAVAPIVFNNGIYDTKYLANGGVTNEPSICGEAGWEAVVPLPDGRTIPVTLHQTTTQKQDNSEVVGVLIEGFDALIERIEKLENSLTAVQRKAINVTQTANEKIYTAVRAKTLN
jgi:hypothetical protein